MQKNTKGMQVEHVKRVRWSHKQLPALFSQRITTHAKSPQRKHELTESSNTIICIARHIDYSYETNEKSCTSGIPNVQGFVEWRDRREILCVSAPWHAMFFLRSVDLTPHNNNTNMQLDEHSHNLPKQTNKHATENLIQKLIPTLW